jgi:archaellum biogenesis ATPase FlaH
MEKNRSPGAGGDRGQGAKQIQQRHFTPYFNTDNIPAELKALPLWSPWRAVWIEDKQKYAKRPVSWRNPEIPVSTTKPDRWASFDKALNAFEAESLISDNAHGIGVMMQPGAIGIDIDNALDANGKIKPAVLTILDALPATYCEMSPSGKGLRAFVFGDYLRDWQAELEDGVKVEVYAGNAKGERKPGGRYLTVTGNVYDEPRPVATADAGTVKALDALHAKYGSRANKPPVKQAEMPDVLNADDLPGVYSLGISEAAKAFLVDGDHDGDRSGMLFRSACELCAVGLTDQEVFSILRHSAHAWEVALNHRGQDDDRAAVYLWVEMALKARSRAVSKVASADEFEELGPLDDDVVDDQAANSGLDASISFIDLSRLNEPPAPRRWVLDQWLTRGSLTILFGAGGHGKSLLSQQLATCIVNGVEFLGIATTKGAVVGLFCEDEADELARRQYAINALFMFDDAAEVTKGLYLDARPGKFNTLATFDAKRLLKPTQLLKSLDKSCTEIKPVLVILDNIAQMFAGGENVRHEVTQFCNALANIAKKHDAAVLLLGHVAKGEDSEYSGSTAWDAAVRARLLLARQPDGTTMLSKAKANYSDREALRMQYVNGVFELIPTGAAMLEADVNRVKDEILEALAYYTTLKASTSHLQTARNFIIRKMIADERLTVPELAAKRVLEEMITDGVLLMDEPLGWQDKSRHEVTGLKVAV